jgi:dUTP pyrophosphatase
MAEEATLYIFVDSLEPELLEIYKKKVQEHNQQIDTNVFPNSGFDLFLPQETTFEHNNFKSHLVDFKIKTEMTVKNTPSAFGIYLRSSICNTPLVLSNHVGVIDSGYRGNLIGAFKSSDSQPYTVEKHSRLLQITNGGLTPIFVELVNESELSSSDRGSGGFGSTGI